MSYAEVKIKFTKIKEMPSREDLSKLLLEWLDLLDQTRAQLWISDRTRLRRKVTATILVEGPKPELGPMEYEFSHVFDTNDSGVRCKAEWTWRVLS